MNHITLTDVEIFNLCKVRLIYLGPAKYGILRDIKHPSPGSIAQRASPSSERKPDNTKKRGRKTTCRKGKWATECRPDSNTLSVKKPRTLTENRNLRYGITNPTPATVTVAGRTRRSCRKDIDYLSLNDGLESEFMDTPKRKPKNSHPPNCKGPTPQRVAAQCASSPETFPEAESAVTTTGSTALIGVLASSSNKSNVTQVPASSTTVLTGVQLPLAESLTAPSLIGVPVSTTLIGVPASGSNKNIATHVSAPSITALTGVQVPPAESPTASSLTGVPITLDTTTTASELTKQDDALDSLPDLVLDDKVGDNTIVTEIAAAVPPASHIKETFNVDPLSSDDDEIDMDAVDALLSLSSVRDDSKDLTLENEQIMPIGGLNLPVDVAPVPIELGQIQIDRAIAELTKQEQMDIQATSKNTDVADADVEVKDTENQNIEITEANKITDSSASKGVFKTTIHGLKKKKDSRRIYKCSICGVRKGSMQLLNDHHKRLHGPQMCGICGRVFELATSLNRHMYTHEEARYKCEKCEFKCYFESELLTHNIVHRQTPTYKCMVANCDRWFKRKW